MDFEADGREIGHRLKTPSNKPQAPGNIQTRSTKNLLSSLKFEYWSFRGVWCLGFAGFRQLLLQRIIERALQIESLDFVDQRLVIGRGDDFLVLEQLDESPLRDELLDRRVVP